MNVTKCFLGGNNITWMNGNFDPLCNISKRWRCPVERLEILYNSMHSSVISPRSFFSMDGAKVHVLRVVGAFLKQNRGAEKCMLAICGITCSTRTKVCLGSKF